ncbi:hypothetical protein GQ53DRAFT_748766 [Thozetella sp. PMI_491]|nr:hypothetical protein GQ53DRAFT_748766 [Thozetella sp. PMI_491]
MSSAGSDLSEVPGVSLPGSQGQSNVPDSPGRSAHSRASDGHALLEKLKQMDIELPDQAGSLESSDSQAAQDSVQVASAPENEDVPDTQPPQDAPTPPAETATRKRKTTATARSRSSKAAPPKKAKRASKKYEAPFVLEDPKSPLAWADLRAILLHPKAWDVLTKEEKQEILGFFPDGTHIMHAGTDGARPNVTSLRNDNHFRHDCVRYCENLELGKHDPDWLRSAWIAHARRNRGDFDDHMVTTFEENWGVELPEEHYPKSLRSKQSDHSHEQDHEDGKASVDNSQRVDEAANEDAAKEGIVAATSSPETEVVVKTDSAADAPDPAAAGGDSMEADLNTSECVP